MKLDVSELENVSAWLYDAISEKDNKKIFEAVEKLKTFVDQCTGDNRRFVFWDIIHQTQDKSDLQIRFQTKKNNYAVLLFEINASSYDVYSIVASVKVDNDEFDGDIGKLYQDINSYFSLASIITTTLLLVESV